MPPPLVSSPDDLAPGSVDRPGAVQQRKYPQPCGFFNDRTRDCHCTSPIIQRYISKISGPLLERIDIHIDVPAVHYKEMRSTSVPESSASIRQRHSGSGYATDPFLRIKGKALLQRPVGSSPHTRLLRAFHGL